MALSPFKKAGPATSFPALDLAPCARAREAKYGIRATVSDVRAEQATADAALAAAMKALGVAEMTGDEAEIEAANAEVAERTAQKEKVSRKLAAGPEAIERRHQELLAADAVLRQQFSDATRPLIEAAEARIRAAAADLVGALTIRAALRLEHAAEVRLPVPSDVIDGPVPVPAADRRVLDETAAVRHALERNGAALRR